MTNQTHTPEDQATMKRLAAELANRTEEAHEFARNATNRFEEGMAAGKLDLIPGNKFRGAYGAAADAGYVRTSINHSSFVQGYMSEMPLSVPLDANGCTLAPPVVGADAIYGTALLSLDLPEEDNTPDDEFSGDRDDEVGIPGRGL